MMLPNILTNATDLYKSIQLLITLTALTTIVWLFLKYYIHRKDSSTYNESSTGSGHSKWIHTLYIGGIATFLILEFIVYVVLNNDEKDNVIDTISFGATLSSLIMSVVAIIFTIVHGRNGETQLGQITQATDELRETASSLDGFKRVTSEMNSHIEDFRSQISQKIDDFNNSIEVKIGDLNQVLCEVRDKTREVREHQLNQAITKEGSNHKSDNYKFSTEQYVESGSYLGTEILLASCYAKKTSKILDLTKLTDIFEGISIDYGYGYLVSSCASGIINVNGNFPKLNVIWVAENLEELCLNKIKTFIKYQPQDKDVFIKKLNTINSYFGESELTADFIDT